MHQTAEQFSARFIPWIETHTLGFNLSVCFSVSWGAQNYIGWCHQIAPAGSLKPQTALPTPHCCSLCSFWHLHQEMKEFYYSAASEYSAFSWPTVSTWLYKQGFGNKTFHWGRKKDRQRAVVLGKVTGIHSQPCLSYQPLSKQVQLHTLQRHNC